ncbi:MAG: TetR/AcrR family transcriptional regulator [Leptospiraceae bacterium]|nr:TetR/AcrR family transcriptional regulator [Leptospiraceae bacterium]
MAAEKNAARSQWLQAGLQLLQQQGPAALRIHNLTARLQLTTGSFYHHFKNRQDFNRALLEYWEEESTLRIIRQSESAGDPRSRIRALGRQTLGIERGAEVAMRTWALENPRAAAVVQRVDEQRLAFIQRLLQEARIPKKQAALHAKMIYAIFIGSQGMVVSVSEQELKSFYRALEALVFPKGS